MIVGIMILIRIIMMIIVLVIPASRWGRDGRVLHGGATDSVQFAIFCFERAECFHALP